MPLFLRPVFTVLLLLNYLLVIGTGAVGRPARVVDRPFAYVHRHDCQLTHQLRLACFDDCNGVQYTVEKSAKRQPLQQLLTQLKGVDVHCAPIWALHLPQPAPAANFLGHWPVDAASWPTGHSGQIELPPCRG